MYCNASKIYPGNCCAIECPLTHVHGGCRFNVCGQYDVSCVSRSYSIQGADRSVVGVSENTCPRDRVSTGCVSCRKTGRDTDMLESSTTVGDASVDGHLAHGLGGDERVGHIGVSDCCRKLGWRRYSAEVAECRLCVRHHARC